MFIILFSYSCVLIIIDTMCLASGLKYFHNLNEVVTCAEITANEINEMDPLSNKMHEKEISCSGKLQHTENVSLLQCLY